MEAVAGSFESEVADGLEEQVQKSALMPPTPTVPPSTGGGSRGHPVLCARPCVRFTKGNCQMGDACGYCHHKTHPTRLTMDKRQRLQVQNMDISLHIYILQCAFLFFSVCFS